MRPLSALCCYIIWIFAGGALLAPWAFQLVNGLADQPGLFASWAGVPFHRVLNRCLIILALAGMVPFVRQLGVRSSSEIGVVFPPGGLRDFAKCLLIGIASIAVVIGVAVVGGGRSLEGGIGSGGWGSIWVKAAAGAFSVALVEELLFRGAILSGFRRTFGWIPALTLSSLVYSAVHFLSAARWHGSVTWTSGFELLPKMAVGFTDSTLIVPAFLTLALAGLALGFVYQRQRHLWGCVALHAGWVLAIRLAAPLAPISENSNLRLWGSDKVSDGWIGAAVLGLLCLWIIRWKTWPAPGTRR